MVTHDHDRPNNRPQATTHDFDTTSKPTLREYLEAAHGGDTPI